MKGKIYVFKETGNEYLILEEGELKHPSTREWISCITYKSVKDGTVYTRELNDFLNKFIEKV